EKDKFLDISYKIFNEFYAKLLQDYHAHHFFNSYSIVEHLIKKLSEILYKIIKDIEENNLQQVLKDLEIIAKRHFDLGINYKVMFDFIDLYINLLKDFKEELGVKDANILELKEYLEYTTAKEYITGLLKSVQDFISAGNSIKTYSRYDVFFEKVIIAKINKMLETFKEISEYYSDTDGKESFKKPNIYLESHTECKVGSFLHGIGSELMTFGNEELRTEAIAIHKVTHVLMRNLVKYYQSKEYEKAVAITNSILNSFYELIYKFELITKAWESNKEKLIPQILDSKKHKNKISLFIISPLELNQNCDRILESIEDSVQKHLESFDFIFSAKTNKNLYIFLNKDYPDFHNLYKNMMKDLEELAKNLESHYMDLKGKNILFMYYFDIEQMLELTEEEVKEIINILKEETYQKSKEKEGFIVNIVKIEEIKDELLEKARKEIELKKLAIEKVLNKDIDIFIQWITDIHLNKRFFEVLARIKKGEDYIPAYKFMSILQRENMMKELDIAVISKLIQEIDKIKALTNEFYLNIYPPSLSDDRVVSLLKELIKLASSKEIMLNLELTEYAIITSKELFEKDMKYELFYLAYDDFGTGYTNYELVGEFTELGIAKTLKVDGSIVKKILQNQTYASIIESITMFCKKTNLRVIYEFVDSEDILKELKNIVASIGFPEERAFLQGFYLHKPSPLDKELEKEQNLTTSKT
ncbi:MAG: EAL domain-containing protein, partial [Hydrogenobaculum sp.]